jgi:flavin reductase (NADH)
MHKVYPSYFLGVKMTELTEVQKEFRSAMAQLSASVNVITTSGPHGQVGITMTAVCSVTDDPPTLLLCVNRRSASRDIFVGNGRLCVNILSSEHEDLAMHFAGATKVPMEERFGWDIWEPRDNHQDQPRLSDAVATLEGRIISSTEQGTHTVMFVEIERIKVQEDRGGLVYFQRKFHPMGALAQHALSA